MADSSIDDSDVTMAATDPVITTSALNDEEFKQPSSSPPSPEYHAHDTGAMPVVVVELTEDGSGGAVVSEWMQCVNEHGETYYCNVYTGETCWQLPVQTEALVDDVNSSHHASDSTVSGDDPATFGGGSLPDGQVDDSTIIKAARPTAHTQRRPFQLVRQVMNGSIKRLDRNVQMQLEETRRRQRELEELRDEQVRLGGEHWVEMYDPTHDCFYYYGMFSGDMRWDKPDSYVMKAESDAILRVVVKLQCAFRMTLARKRVFQMKLLAAERQRQLGLLHEHQALETEVSAALDDAQNDVNADNVWVEVYDPFHKVVYYYCSITGETRWDPPTFFISANEDKEMAAAIAIQALSRSFLARRDVKQRKTTLRKKRQEQAMNEARRLRELRHREFLSKSEDDRSSICRREMIEEEMEQIRSGDRFWGVDAHNREVRRQLSEERLMATAEVFWQRVNLAMKMRGELHQHKTKEQELKHKEYEAMAEANARDAMSLEEALQRRLYDNFWGIQGEEQRESRARRDMADEELLSRCFGQELHVRDLHFAWKDEAEIKSVRDARNKVVNEKRYQKHYLKWFYQDCTSVDDLLDYLWPTMQRFVPKSTAKKKKKKSLDGDDDLEQYYNSSSPGSSYILDDLVVKERLEHGDLRYGNKSIFTIHHPNSAQILGRKGGFSMEKVVQTKAVFEQTAAIRQPVSTSPSRSMPPRVEMTPEEEYLRMSTSVHYKRSKISPTQEILCSSHTKLNQLPSLSVSSKLSSKSSSKKMKQQHKFDLWTSNNNNNNNSPRSNSFMQQHLTKFGHPTVDSMATTFGFAGPYAIEDKARQRCGLGNGERDNDDDAEERDHFDGGDDDGESDDVGDQRQHQLRLEVFARRFAVEEHDVLLRVFSMMDYDGSGAVNKQEMTWALQRDEEISALASKSMLLRVFLKQHTHLDELFSHLEGSGGGQGGGQYHPALVDTLDHNKSRRQQSEELSWQVFIVFCEQMYINLMDQGLLPLLGQEREVYNSQPEGPQRKQSQHQQHQQSEAPENEDPNAYREDEEERKIRNLFAILDNDANGVLEVEELQQALYDASNDEISELVRSSKALQPLLHEEMFMNAFRKFETEDPRGISEEEFVGFCLEIASIAMLNGML